MLKNNIYLPEGDRIDTQYNRDAVETLDALALAKENGMILEGRVVRCDTEHNLYVQLPCGECVIPHEESALGIAEGLVKESAVISRVGKVVSFMVTGFEHIDRGVQPILSRRAAQEQCKENYVSKLKLGDVIPARITSFAYFGAFCDIGCGVTALFPIGNIAVSRIKHPSDLLSVGMDVLGLVVSLENNRVTLSQRELLGTWEENAAQFREGEIVLGIVRSVETYGPFVELTPNLCGLAEPMDGVRAGQLAAVYIKSIQPDKQKVKLAIVNLQNNDSPPAPPKYFISEGPLTYWRYSPEGNDRVIEFRLDG